LEFVPEEKGVKNYIAINILATENLPDAENRVMWRKSISV
jgi:hypothetical protein